MGCVDFTSCVSKSVTWALFLLCKGGQKSDSVHICNWKFLRIECMNEHKPPTDFLTLPVSPGQRQSRTMCVWMWSWRQSSGRASGRRRRKRTRHWKILSPGWRPSSTAGEVVRTALCCRARLTSWVLIQQCEGKEHLFSLTFGLYFQRV